MERIDALILALEIGGLSASIFSLIKSGRMISEETELLEFFKRAEVLEPRDLHQMLGGNRLSYLGEDIMKLNKNELTAKFICLVKGFVKSNSPIPSLLNSAKSLVLRRLVVEPLFISEEQNLQVQASPNIPTGIKNEFRLQDQSGEFALVKPNSQTVVDDGLTCIGVRKIFESGFVVRLAAEAVSILNGIFGFKNRLNLIRNVKIGERTTELGIAIGQSLGIFGKVALDLKDQSVVIEKPYFFFQNKQDLINRFTWRLKRWRMIYFISKILVCVGLFITARHLSGIIKQVLQKIRQMKLARKRDRLSGSSKVLVKELCCIVCKKQPVGVINKPCLHMTCCKDCQQTRSIDTCLSCGKQVKETVSLYVI